MEQQSKDQEEEALDLLSPRFDPLLVLQASPSKVSLPYPDVQACDNLEAYRSIMHRTRRPAQADAAPPPVDPTPEDELVLPERQEKPDKTEKSVLWFMQNCTTGPFSFVGRCYANKQRVRVWIRHCAGVRGVCEGVLLAFDKHLNLVLGDVYEQYTPLRTVSNGGKVTKTTDDTKARRKRKRKKKRAAGGAVGTTRGDDDAGHCITTDELITEEHGGLETQKQSETKTPSHAPESVDSACVQEITSITGDCKSEPQSPAITVSTERASFEISRHVKQLFVRGDNVVLISHTHPHPVQ